MVATLSTEGRVLAPGHPLAPIFLFNPEPTPNPLNVTPVYVCTITVHPSTSIPPYIYPLVTNPKTDHNSVLTRSHIPVVLLMRGLAKDSVFDGFDGRQRNFFDRREVSRPKEKRLTTHRQNAIESQRTD